MIFALAGNQNCGKTTLFNALTGSNQHVGNFPGVTVDQKIGEIKNSQGDSVVDLPGIYSIRPYSNEEIVTRDFILTGHPDGIINIIDATNIERNLYLTLQLISLKIPMVLALNMMDEVRANAGSVDIKKMSHALGIPVVPISAAKNEGISELIEQALYTAKKKIIPTVYDFCQPGPIHRCIHAVTHLVEDHAENAGVSARFAATKLIEGDEPMTDKLGLDENERELIEHTVVEMEHDCALDRNAAIAQMRYEFIERVCRECVVKCKDSREHIRSVRIDRLLTNKYAAIPVFVGIMLLVFWLTFDVIGAALSGLLNTGIDMLTTAVNTALVNFGTNEVVRSLVVDGIFAGVGSVLSFLPVIVVLFFFLSVLEDTGYMARIAFVTDKLLRKLGLSGRSIVPMLIGFGCSVPAVMATRTLSSERDRRMTVMLIPFMSCSAKITIYAFFTEFFFAQYKALIMLGLYIFGIVIGVTVALIGKSTVFRGKPVPFVMELPNYRLPGMKNTLLLMWNKARDFLHKAFTVIFAATVIVWFFRSFDSRINFVSDSSQSMLASIGQFISPLFKPLGFGDWRISTALIAGFTAKEAVVSTLEVLLGGASLSSAFKPVSAMSFLVFTLLYTPCVAAVSVIRREMNSIWKTVLTVVLQCGIAWLCAFVVYRTALLIF